jgi:four helix bundle protein
VAEQQEQPMKLQETRIYTVSIELNQTCGRIVAKFPSGYSWLADQVRRAASSVTLTFAEGFRRSSARERRHFFTMSAASATEVFAAIDVARAYGIANEESRDAVEKMTNHLSAMLRLFR